jgi:hypothetical protein
VSRHPGSDAPVEAVILAERRTRYLVVGYEDHGTTDEFGTLTVLAPTEREPFMCPWSIRVTARAKRLRDKRHKPARFDMQCTVRASDGRVPAGRERGQRGERALPAALVAL